MRIKTGNNRQAVKRMPDTEKVIKGLESLHDRLLDVAKQDAIVMLDVSMVADAIALLKEQEAEIRQLRLALDIAKGTCKGIIMEGR